MLEEWRPIKDFPGYEVSSHGRVRALRKTREPHVMRGHLLRGMWRVGLYRNGKQVSTPVKRLVAAAFLPRLPDRSYLAHKDGDPRNCALENLVPTSPRRRRCAGHREPFFELAVPENWRPLHLSTDYEISDQGRVRRIARRGEPISPFLVRTFLTDPDDRCMASIQKPDGKRILCAVSHAVVRAFVPEYGRPVRFRNGDTSDCRLSNLIVPRAVRNTRWRRRKRAVFQERRQPLTEREHHHV